MARRVCMFLQNPFTHDVRVLKEGRSLARAGWDVRLIAARGPGLPFEEERDGIRITRVPAEPPGAGMARAALGQPAGGTSRRTPDPGNDGGASPRQAILDRALPSLVAASRTMAWWWFVAGGLRAAISEPADVWLAHDLPTLPLALAARSRSGGRVIYDSHEIYPALPDQRAVWRWRWRMIERALIGRADQVLTVSDAYAAELAERNRTAVPLVVGNYPEVHERPERTDLIREACDVPKERNVALYAGGVTRHRRLEVVVRAVSHMPDVDLVLMGPTQDDYANELRALAGELNVAERVHLLDPVEPSEVVRWAASADVGLIPFQDVGVGYYSAMPNKLFEYLAAGLPIAASDFPQMRSVVLGRNAGEMFDPTDPADIAGAVRKIVEDPQRHEEMAAAALSASSDFTWQRAAAVLLDAAAGTAAAGRPDLPA